MAKRGKSFNACAACDGENPGVVKLTATDVNGHVLDSTWLCRGCVPGATEETWLCLGDLSRLPDDRERLTQEDRAARRATETEEK